MKISVVGQGYVGLPLALAAVEAGYEVVGIDIDPNKIVGLNSGVSGIEDISSDELRSAFHHKNTL